MLSLCFVIGEQFRLFVYYIEKVFLTITGWHRRNDIKRTIITVLIIGIICPLIYAGVGVGIKCSNDECNYKSEVDTGTGKRSTAVSGYCVKCKKMVTVRFEKDKSKVIAQVWDSATGKVLDLYECPHCKKPFAEAKQIVFCPKCNKKTVSTEITAKWD